jgi:streptogramin lyase
MSPSASAGHFEDLGVPVTVGMNMGWLVGPNAAGDKDLVYVDVHQSAGPLFMVAVDPDTGECAQYNAPDGCDDGAWGFHLGLDRRIYFGTWGRGQVLRFDPKHPDKGIVLLGSPSATETYIWVYCTGPDGKLYGGTYGNAHLVRVDPATDKLEDLGRMDDREEYTRSIAADDRYVYVGAGFARANLIRFDPKTGEHVSIWPDDLRVTGCPSLYRAGDGKVYAALNDKCFRMDDGKPVAIPPAQQPGAVGLKLRDGRLITDCDVDSFVVVNPADNSRRTVKFHPHGQGAGTFVIGAGPDGCIYGSTAMPLRMFRYDPRTGKSEDLGNPCPPAGGEIYSFLAVDGKLWACAYGGSVLSVYDPARPWALGNKPDSNPRVYGFLGDGHLRPRAMILGPGGNLYIGSHPAYGELGGAMAVFDRAAFKVVENYRNLIPNQAIVALAYDPHSGLVFGGSSIAGGGGAHLTETQAHFFAWDPVAKKRVEDLAFGPETNTISAMTIAAGKVFFACAPANVLRVYDIAQRRIIRGAMKPLQDLREISLGIAADGRIIGLTGRAVIAIDPKTYAVTEIAASPVPISCGFALTRDAVYFGSGVHLFRYRF